MKFAVITKIKPRSLSTISTLQSKPLRLIYENVQTQLGKDFWKRLKSASFFVLTAMPKFIILTFPLRFSNTESAALTIELRGHKIERKEL